MISRGQGRAEGAEGRLGALVGLLDAALRLWRGAPENEEACVLAAKGYLLLKEDHPELAEKLNATLHLLTRRPTDPALSAAEEAVLDVRALPPRDRHDRIFAAWKELPSGGAFLLVNDHDPKPLYYQFQAEHAGAFRWEYVEAGPEVWRVRIGKLS